VSERAAPFYCPYCGDEDLRPSEEGHGTWECAACNRAFKLSFLGLLARGLPRDESGSSEERQEGNRTP
jgi:transposase-like protein